MKKPSARMRFGIQPTGWTNDDFPEIGNETAYQKILAETEEAGFAGGSTGHNYPAHIPSLLNAMGSLEIVSTWAGTSFTTGVDAAGAFAAFQAQVAFLEDVGAKDVVVAELANAVNQVRTKRVLLDRPILNEGQWFLLTESLNRAGEYANKQGMQLSYHPHVGTCVMTVEETERLLEHTHSKYVGLCLDTAHLAFGGASQEQIVALTKKYATRITHVHLKNVREQVLIKSRNTSFYQAIQEGIFTVPGDPHGALDLVPIVRILKEAGFRGWMVIEAEQNPANPDPCAHKHITPLEYAKMARRFLRKNLGY